MEAVVNNYRKIQADTTFADLSIKMQKETLLAHRAIVAVRCEELCPMPDTTGKKKIKDKTSVPVKNISNTAIMNKILEFLYTGTIDWSAMSPDAIMELNKAAKIFKLSRLSFLCEDFFQQNLTLTNIFAVLVAAHRLNEPTVKSFCKFFAIEHFNEVVTNTEGLHVLGIDLFQEVVTAYLTFQATGSLSKVQLGDPPECTVLRDLERMYKMMPYSDFKFVIEGEEHPCHKAVLGGVSEKFKQVMTTGPSGGMSLNGISSEAFKSMLKFVYYGYDNIEPLPACELVGFARNYDLHSLVTLCEDKIRNSIEKTTVLGILEVAYAPEMAQKQELVEELKSKTFPFVAENLSSIDLSTLRTRMNAKSVHIAADLLVYLQGIYQSQKK